jgi:endonuclease YncB( thermonuclease family)
MKLIDVPKFGLEGLIMRDARVVKVHDGDTITVVHHMGTFREVRQVNVRILDVNAPEVNLLTRKMGLEAREHLLRVIKAPVDPNNKHDPEYFEANDVRVDVHCGRFDPFGRILGEVHVDGESIKGALLANPLYKPYERKRSGDQLQ